MLLETGDWLLPALVAVGVVVAVAIVAYEVWHFRARKRARSASSRSLVSEPKPMTPEEEARRSARREATRSPRNTAAPEPEAPPPPPKREPPEELRILDVAALRAAAGSSRQQQRGEAPLISDVTISDSPIAESSGSSVRTPVTDEETEAATVAADWEEERVAGEMTPPGALGDKGDLDDLPAGHIPEIKAGIPALSNRRPVVHQWDYEEEDEVERIPTDPYDAARRRAEAVEEEEESAVAAEAYAWSAGNVEQDSGLDEEEGRNWDQVGPADAAADESFDLIKIARKSAQMKRVEAEEAARAALQSGSAVEEAKFDLHQMPLRIVREHGKTRLEDGRTPRSARNEARPLPVEEEEEGDELPLHPYVETVDPHDSGEWEPVPEAAPEQSGDSDDDDPAPAPRSALQASQPDVDDERARVSDSMIHEPVTALDSGDQEEESDEDQEEEDFGTVASTDSNGFQVVQSSGTFLETADPNPLRDSMVLPPVSIGLNDTDSDGDVDWDDSDDGNDDENEEEQEEEEAGDAEESGPRFRDSLIHEPVAEVSDSTESGPQGEWEDEEQEETEEDQEQEPESASNGTVRLSDSIIHPSVPDPSEDNEAQEEEAVDELPAPDTPSHRMRLVGRDGDDIPVDNAVNPDSMRFGVSDPEPLSVDDVQIPAGIALDEPDEEDRPGAARRAQRRALTERAYGMMDAEDGN